MSVFRRPGRKVWWFEFEYRGRRYRESAGTQSKTLAIDIERKRRREVEEAANGIRRNRDAAIPFSAAATEWLQLKKATWAPKTHIIAKTDVGHLKAHFGKLLLIDITDQEVARYQTKRRENASNKTINNEIGHSVRSFAATGSGRRLRRTFGCWPFATMSGGHYRSTRKRDC